MDKARDSNNNIHYFATAIGPKAAVDVILGSLEVFQHLEHSRFSKHIYRMKKMKTCIGEEEDMEKESWVTVTPSQGRQGKSILLDRHAMTRGVPAWWRRTSLGLEPLDANVEEFPKALVRRTGP